MSSIQAEKLTKVYGTGETAITALLFLVGLVLVAPALVKPFANAFGILTALLFAREGTGELAQGNLTRQPSRAAITASATMIGLAIVVGAGGMMFSLNDSLMALFQKTMGSDYLLVPPSISVWKGNVGASTSLGNKIRSTDGVGAVSTLRYAQSYTRSESASVKGANETTISVLGIDPVEYLKVSAMDFQKGNQPETFAALARRTQHHREWHPRRASQPEGRRHHSAFDTRRSAGLSHRRCWRRCA